MPPISDSMQECIDNCLVCHRTCAETAQQCLERGGDHAAPAHLTVLLDCAGICHISAEFMLRQSPRHHLTCWACAECCDQCAVECDHFGHTACAEACRTCAASCHSMAAVTAGAPDHRM
jgi:hypothetical protein